MQILFAIINDYSWLSRTHNFEQDISIQGFIDGKPISEVFESSSRSKDRTLLGSCHEMGVSSRWNFRFYPTCRESIRISKCISSRYRTHLGQVFNPDNSRQLHFNDRQLFRRVYRAIPTLKDIHVTIKMSFLVKVEFSRDYWLVPIFCNPLCLAIGGLRPSLIHRIQQLVPIGVKSAPPVNAVISLLCKLGEDSCWRVLRAWSTLLLS